MLGIHTIHTEVNDTRCSRDDAEQIAASLLKLLSRRGFIQLRSAPEIAVDFVGKQSAA